MDRKTILDMLRRTTEDVQRYVNEIPAERLHWHEPGEWSAHETLAHVCTVERNVFLARMQRVIKEEHPTLRYFDEKVWHDAHYTPEQPLSEMLADFAGARAQEIALLEAQPDWSRWGLHEMLRKRYSLEFMAHYAFRHTWEHLNQIASTQVAYELAYQDG